LEDVEYIKKKKLDLEVMTKMICVEKGLTIKATKRLLFLSYAFTEYDILSVRKLLEQLTPPADQ